MTLKQKTKLEKLLSAARVAEDKAHIDSQDHMRITDAGDTEESRAKFFATGHDLFKVFVDAGTKVDELELQLKDAVK